MASHILYIFIAFGDGIMKREKVGIPLTNLTPPYVCAFHKPGYGMPYVVASFVFNELG
jgi:hypothetical protein